jgi:hypothetical protein
MVVVLDASGVLKQRPPLANERKARCRLAAAILPDGSTRGRVSESGKLRLHKTSSCWPCRRSLCDVELELALRGCNAACCLSTPLVHLRLPYFISVLLQVCCDCRCSKTVVVLASLVGRCSSTITPAYRCHVVAQLTPLVLCSFPSPRHVRSEV